LNKEFPVKSRRRRSESRSQAPKSNPLEIPFDALVEKAARRAFANFLRGILKGGDQEPSRTG
jgi:hypothetical protein